MTINSLNLLNFRNFANKKIVFDPKLTVIVGANGIGKSNILEAVGLLCGVRLKKVESDLDFVRFLQSETKIESRISPGAGLADETLTINLQVIDERVVRRSYLVDAIKKRQADFVSHLSIVVFEPADLDLVSGSPSLRRHHLDLLLSGMDRDYWRAITSYNKVIVRRNKVLGRIAEGGAKRSELDFWDSRLLEHGKEIEKRREEFFEYLDFIENKEYKWHLKKSVIFAQKLLDNRERDIAAGVTLSGPHRDDFEFLFGGKNLEFFGSRGEQRMAVLALKLSELEYFNLKRGARPILALDDIFSELDWEHRGEILKVVSKQQTVITAAESESVPKELLRAAGVVELR